MKKNRKALLLTLVTMASLSSCSIRNQIKSENKEEHTIVENYSNIDSASNNELNEIITTINSTKDNDGYSEVFKYAYLTEDAILYTFYENDMHEVTTIEKFQKVFVESSNGIYARVHTDNDMIGYILINSLEYLPKDYVELDLSDQEVKVYNDNELVFRANVVTGGPATPTDEGYTEILEKTYKRYLVGDNYKVWVEYLFPFNYNGEGYHDASWQPSFGGDAYLYRGSHGCCNMSLSNIEIMNRYIEVGTKNLVHK